MSLALLPLLALLAREFLVAVPVYAAKSFVRMTSFGKGTAPN
jgi:hypothetical protein